MTVDTRPQIEKFNEKSHEILTRPVDPSSTTVAEVQELDAAGGITRKLENAILKDSLTIPDGGYTIIRFTADNSYIDQNNLES